MRKFFTDEHGASALEMALALPIFLLIVFGIMGLGFTLYTENTIQYAVEQAARCAAINSTDCGTQQQVANAAAAWSNGLLTDTSKVSVDLNASCGKAVEIEYPVTFFVISTTVAAEACYPSLS